MDNSCATGQHPWHCLHALRMAKRVEAKATRAGGPKRETAGRKGQRHSDGHAARAARAARAAHAAHAAPPTDLNPSLRIDLVTIRSLALSKLPQPTRRQNYTALSLSPASTAQSPRPPPLPGSVPFLTSVGLPVACDRPGRGERPTFHHRSIVKSLAPITTQ